MKMYDAQKAKRLLIKLKYQKFQASISKWDVLIMLSSKDLGFYEFRTLICIVGKLWLK